MDSFCGLDIPFLNRAAHASRQACKKVIAMNEQNFRQVSTESDWAHSGRRRHHSSSRSSQARRNKRYKRQQQIRRSQMIYGILCSLGVLGGAAAAFVIHFTILKVIIGASVGLLGGLALGLLFER